MPEEETYSKVLSKQIVEEPTPPEEPPKPKKTGTATKKKSTAKTKKEPVMSSSGKFVLYYKETPTSTRPRDASGRFVSTSLSKSQPATSAPATGTKSTTSSGVKSTTSSGVKSTTSTVKTTRESAVATTRKPTPPPKPKYPDKEPESSLRPRVKVQKKWLWEDVFARWSWLPLVAVAFLVYFFGAYLLLSVNFAKPETAEFLQSNNWLDLRFDTYGYNEIFAFISPIAFVGAVNLSFGFLAYYGWKLFPEKLHIYNPSMRNRTSMPKATITPKTRPFAIVFTVIAFIAYALVLFVTLRSAYIDYFEPYFTESDTWIPFTQKNFITQKEPLTFVACAIVASIFSVGMNIFIAVKDAPVWVFVLCNFLLPLLTYFIVALIAIALLFLVVLGIIGWLKENF